jgi:hypothetical protein
VAGKVITHIGASSGDDAAGWSLIEIGIPETIGFVPSLRCFPRSWGSLPPAWTSPHQMRRVTVESVAFGERFDARVDAEQERNWLLQLLSPEFVDWLCEDAQARFGFELHEGALRCFAPGRLEGEPAQLLTAEAGRVAERIRSEALESEGLGVRELGSGVPERIERAVEEVSFEAMPPDTRTASLPFRAVAARDPRVYVAALGGVVTAFTLLFVLLLQFDVDMIEIAVDVVGWIGPKGTGIGIGVLALVGWLGAIPGAIAVASHGYGRVAFAREYAKARHYRLESPQSFHRRLMRVALPAPAEFVYSGSVAGERFGRLVCCRSRRGPFANYYDAVVVEAHDRSGEGQSDAISWKVDDGFLVFSRPAASAHTAAELDELSERAKTVFESLSRP